jgi:hypothetical protein
MLVKTGVRIDENTSHGRQGCYELTRVYLTERGHKIRVTVNRDSYEIQSYAKAEVLTADLKWTTLATDGPSNWHSDTPHTAATPVAIKVALDRTANLLAARAVTILN